MSREDMVYGIRPVMEAIQAGKEIEKLLFQQGLRGELYHELLLMVRESGFPFQYVPVQKLNRITTKNHQGVVAFLSPATYHRLDDLLPSLFESGEVPFLLVIDRVTDVRNFGALARTAEAAGVHALLFPSRGTAALNEDAVKTSAGALLRMPLCRVANLKTALTFLKESGLMVFGLSEKGDLPHTQADFSAPLALLAGSEEDGISPAYLPYCDSLLRIPMMGEIASLNVSVAGGIVMFEVLAQRTTQGS